MSKPDDEIHYIHVCGDVLLSDGWLKANADDIAVCGMPTCVVCDRPLRKGSVVDHFWPYHSERCHHKACAKAFHRQWAADMARHYSDTTAPPD